MSNRVDSVIQKYRLAELTFIDAELNGKKLGHGKLMSDDCLRRFVAADPSKDNKYLDWMLYMAGGGQEAMDKSLQLWNGEGQDDQNSLRNLCHKDFITERTQGCTDDNGMSHKPVSKEAAEAEWQENESRCLFEFIMGDQDIAAEDGYGFFREWPGKDNLYERIVNVVQMWHNAQPKLLGQNKAIQRAALLRSAPQGGWTDDDRRFMTKWSDDPAKVVELDLYAKWKSKEFNQVSATYNTIQKVLQQISGVRRTQIIRDDRHDVIYEDTVVKVICPLTVGASLKYGSSKWCVSNRTEFDRTLESNSYGTGHNWKKYTSEGPLIFLLFKVPMPIWCSKMAIHVQSGDLCLLEKTIRKVAWFDVQNAPGTTYRMTDMLKRVAEEHLSVNYSTASSMSADDKALSLCGRQPKRAWTNLRDADRVEESIDKAVAHIVSWGLKFNTNRIIVDYLVDLSGTVIK